MQLEAQAESGLPSDDERLVPILVTSVFIIASCGIFYELLISTISSYFLGSSVLHFSITIGLFMSFMGAGSYLSRFVHDRLLERFIQAEIAIGIVGGCSTLLLYLSFSITPYYYLLATVLIAIVATLVGLEIPLVTRLVYERESIREALARVLAFDYLGALVSSVLFPLVLLPYLGLMKTSFLIGILNLCVALVNIRYFSALLARSSLYLWVTMIGIGGLGAGFAYSLTLVGFFEQFLYEDEIVYSTQTQYQKLVLTRFRDDVRLYINGDLQFSSTDEHRYHEALVHIPMSLAARHEDVLILGGGDGLAVREILKHGGVKHVTLVDIDPEMPRMSRTQPMLVQLNAGSLSDPRVTVVSEDAQKFVETRSDRFDVIIIDLPDPNDHSLGKLYSQEFYSLAARRLAAGGILVTQSTSPYFAPKAFWMIGHTLKTAFASVRSYHTFVPSFGDWGFHIASATNIDPSRARLDVPARFLTPEVIPGLFVFDGDMREVATDVNRLDNQLLVQEYESSWRRWNEP